MKKVWILIIKLINGIIWFYFYLLVMIGTMITIYYDKTYNLVLVLRLEIFIQGFSNYILALYLLNFKTLYPYFLWVLKILKTIQLLELTELRSVLFFFNTMLCHCFQIYSIILYTTLHYFSPRWTKHIFSVYRQYFFFTIWLLTSYN